MRSVSFRALVVSALLASFVAAPVVAMAGPPYQTDDPEPTAYRHYEIYVFGTYDNEPGQGVGANWPSLEVNYGLMPNVQFSVTAPFAAAKAPGMPLQSGYGDTEVALKMRFIQEGAGRPQVSFYPSVELPTAPAGIGNGLPKVFLPLWAQKTNGSWTYFGGGGVWHNPGFGNRDYTFTGFAATREVRDGLSIGGEIYHQTADTIGGHDSTAVGIGFVAERGEHHALLASFGRSIAGDHAFTGYAAYELYLGPKESVAKP
ncbi:MAG TPA: hypothetical protein VHT05_05185 [Candidatus Elarobacter sp.]|nr:hypothetical protein [Candidatus Elarobacter sp.]